VTSAEPVLVNGVPADAVSSLDRGLHFGDGLFETIACVQGVPRFLSLHLQRLASGCQRLQIEAPDLVATRAEVQSFAGPPGAASGRCIVKVLMTRGVATVRGYAASGREKATRITIRYPWPPEDPRHVQDGVTARTLAMRLGENTLLAGLKHCNRLEQVLARSQMSGESEGLLFSSSGKLVSGTMSNVFLVHGSLVRTPRLDCCGVAGVMRRVVMQEAAAMGVPVEERELRQVDLATADEVFLTNARIGIWPVSRLDDRALAVGPVTRRLQQALSPLLEIPAHA